MLTSFTFQNSIFWSSRLVQTVLAVIDGIFLVVKVVIVTQAQARQVFFTRVWCEVIKLTIICLNQCRLADSQLLFRLIGLEAFDLVRVSLMHYLARLFLSELLLILASQLFFNPSVLVLLSG